MGCRSGCVLLAVLGLGEWAVGQTARTAPTASAPARVSAADLERAVAELGDGRWGVRRTAGFTLIDAGEASVPALRRGYLETRSHEVRLRIRELAEAIFSETRSPGRGGFLGIRQRPRLHRMDPRVPTDTTWVEVLQVFRDTAADRGGLRPGDLVIRCDGQPFPEDPTGQVFGSVVAPHRPGTEISLEIIRGTDAPMTLKVRLGHRPMSVLVEADPEAYATIRAAFDDWWQQQFGSPTGGPAKGRSTTTRPAKDHSLRR